MSSQWESIERDIKDALEHAVERRGHGAYRELAALAPGLGRFPDAQALLEFLRAQAGTEGERDVLLGELLRASRNPGKSAAQARDLLWLALWPGLSSLWHGTKVPPGDDPAELVAQLVHKLAVVIDCLDLGAVTKLAGTLMGNTRRRFWEELRARRETRKEEVSLGRKVEAIADSALKQDVIDVLLDIEKIAGRDAMMVLDCAVGGMTTREAARVFGCTREAAKKRVTRALARLRRDESDGLGETAVPDHLGGPLFVGKGRSEAAVAGGAGMACGCCGPTDGDDHGEPRPRDGDSVEADERG